LIDFRLYRAGFAPALAAVIVLLFALTAPPDPLPSAVAPAEFDGDGATRIARQIVETAPDRAPGSTGDAEIAGFVARHFQQVEGGEISEQTFTGQFGGDDVDMKNVILTLPGGDSTRSIVLMAPRDSAGSPGAASSAAATGMLLQLVNHLRTQSHPKTLVFVSTDGSSAGAAGAREFARSYAARDQIDAVIDLWQPGYASPHAPFVLESSAGPQSPPAQLARTVEHVLSEQTTHKQGSEGALPSLAGLALPSGLGEPAVLIQSGLDAVGLSSAGARPLPESRDQLADLSSSSMSDFGRTALLVVAAIEANGGSLEHGPGTYIPMAGNLVPGWTLSLLALALLLPAALAAADGIRRGVRREHRKRHMPVSGAEAPSPNTRAAWAIAWAATRALPLIAGLFFFYLLGLVGLVADPPFPFDPNLFDVGPGQVIVMLLCALVVGGTYYALRGWRVPASLPSHAAVPALGAVSVLAVFLAWLANPYMGLLLVPTAHVWVACAGRRDLRPRAVVAAAALISLVPAIAALDHVSGELAAGASAPWLLLLMVSDGQIGFGTMFASSLVLGSLSGIVAVSLRDRVPSRRTDTLDASPITSSRQDDDKANDR